MNNTPDNPEQLPAYACSGSLDKNADKWKCLCGSQNSGDKCLWCGALRDFNFPSGSKVHVWLTNGQVTGTITSIPPQFEDGIVSVPNPSTGVDSKIDSNKWREAESSGDKGIGSLNYQTGVAVMFALQLDPTSSDAVQSLLGCQKPVLLETENCPVDDATQKYVLSRIYSS